MNKQEFQKQVKPSDAQISGCLKGQIEISYDRLLELLGKPSLGSGDNKVAVAWTVSFKGKTFYIYNYKDGKNYCGAEGLNTEDITDWHIGGDLEEVAKELIELMQSVED